MAKRKIYPVFIVLLVILSILGRLSVLTSNKVITEKEAIEISEGYVKNSDIYRGMKAKLMTLQSLLALKKWKVVRKLPGGLPRDTWVTHLTPR